MKRLKQFKSNHNFKQVTGMLPLSITSKMVRHVDYALNAEFLVFPNLIVLSYPITYSLPSGISRDVRTRLKRDLKRIQTEYEPRYTLETFSKLPFSKNVASADLEDIKEMDQNYINTVNVMTYLGHSCDKCGEYRTDVGFDAQANIVYECAGCGDLLVDDTQTVSAKGWVTNLMGADNDEGGF